MQEQFSYSLMASGLGILIVFGILVLLSGLMILIRKLSDKESPNEEIKAAASSSSKTVRRSSGSLPLPVLVAAAAEGVSAGAGSAEWVAAAVASFFASEEDDSMAPSASVWATSVYTKYDPWVANNKLSKTVPGERVL